ASVGDSAFEDCTHLAEVNLFSHIPNGNEIAYLGNNAFKNCTALRYFTIPYRVGYIMPGAFENCSSLAYLVIEVNQNGYTYMPGSFIGCTALKDLYLYAATGTDSASAQADTCLNFGNSGAPNSLNGNKNVHFYPTSTQMAQADRDGYLIGLHPYFKFVSGKVEDIPER
ncbi:MAG: leucine-rich repeat domain-containing protein, partial [Clostridia bacterium]|nr:leucine-rich repeat domain-containing protein [Clostridia bacterium]